MTNCAVQRVRVRMRVRMRRSIGLDVLSSDHISMYIYLFNIGDSSGPNARGWIGFPLEPKPPMGDLSICGPFMESPILKVSD